MKLRCQHKDEGGQFYCFVDSSFSAILKLRKGWVFSTKRYFFVLIYILLPATFCISPSLWSGEEKSQQKDMRR